METELSQGASNSNDATHLLFEGQAVAGLRLTLQGEKAVAGDEAFLRMAPGIATEGPDSAPFLYA